MVFVNSMSDLFHEEIPLSYILRVVATMNLARWHTYQVLTKRSGRLRELLSGPLQDAAREPHIWWGVSVEDRLYGLPRIEDLQRTPLLEDLGALPLEGISWVIVGGESGPGARRMEENWVLSIREQCETANVPFFFKQWGGVRKKAAGRMLLGRTHDGIPNRVQHSVIPARLRLRHAAAIESGAYVQLE
jgi:protein gp37